MKIIKVYNRKPTVHEYMWDGSQYEIQPHTVEHVTLEMANMACETGILLRTPGNYETFVFGVVPETHPDFESPLTQEDIDEIQGPAKWEYRLEDLVDLYKQKGADIKMSDIKLASLNPVGGEMPQIRPPADSTVEVSVTAKRPF